MADAALEAAGRALADWDVEVLRVEQISHSENVVFRVEDRAHRAYVLRLHRPGYHTLGELESEQTWASALLAAGIDVPVPKLTRCGRGYTQVAFDGATRNAGMLEWVDGEPMGTLIDAGADGALVTARFAQIGELMAVLHEQAIGWCVPGGFERHAFDADGLMGESPFWGRFWESSALNRAQQYQLEAIRGRVYRVLCDYGKRHDTYSLIHADLHPDNIVVDGARLHVIDFDDAGFGWHQYDIAVALFEYRYRDDFPAILQALVEGYRRVRLLSERALEYVPLFLLVRMLAVIGWIEGRPEHDLGGDVPELVERIGAEAESVLLTHE